MSFFSSRSNKTVPSFTEKSSGKGCLCSSRLPTCMRSHYQKNLNKNLKRIMISVLRSFPLKCSNKNISDIFWLFSGLTFEFYFSRFNYCSSKEDGFLCAHLFLILKSNTYAEHFVFFNKVQIIPKVIFSTC